MVVQFRTIRKTILVHLILMGFFQMIPFSKFLQAYFVTFNDFLYTKWIKGLKNANLQEMRNFYFSYNLDEFFVIDSLQRGLSIISTDLLLSLTIFSSKRSKRGGQFHIICQKFSFHPILLGFFTIWFFMNNVTKVTPVLRIIRVKIDPVILLCPVPCCAHYIITSEYCSWVKWHVFLWTVAFVS